MTKMILAALLFVYGVGSTSIARAQSDTMGGIANAAQQASARDSSVQMASVIMAAAFAARCSSWNPGACVMAALAAAQAAAAGKAGSGALYTASLQSQGVNNGTTVGGVDTNSRGVDAQLEQIRAELGKKGVEVSPDGKTISLPDGKTVPFDASSVTPEGMASNGFTADQISAAQSALAEAQEKAAKYAASSAGSDKAKLGGGLEGDLGGGAGGGSVGSGGYTGGSFASKTYVVRRGASTGKGAANLSGMTKNFGTDKIGVSADHIFEMVSRRYKAKEASNTFISN